MRCSGLREYKKYLIQQYKETGDKWYRKECRRIDKQIKRILKEKDETNNRRMVDNTNNNINSCTTANKSFK